MARASQFEQPRQDRAVTGTRRRSEFIPTPVNQLRNARTGDAENGNSVFGGADRRDSSVQPVLSFAPIDNIHGRNDERLRAKLNQPVGHPAVAKVVADTNSEPSPR